MTCIWKFAFILTVFFLVENNGSSIGASEDISTKDVPVPKEDNNEVNEVSSEIPEVLEVDAVSDRFDDKPKQCAEIGAFCINHLECCSNACLGYMRRCVSGSG